MHLLSRETSSPEATGALAAGLADVLRAGDVVRLEGDLGAGKTTFARTLVTALGCDPRSASSPTFVMINISDAHPQPSSRPDAPARVAHVDAYRLRSSEDVESLGWDAIMQHGSAAPSTVLIVEWPERIEDALPPRSACAIVSLLATGERSRRIEIMLPDSWSTRPLVHELIERVPIRCQATGAWVRPTSSTYPFADQRTKDADLYKWFSGKHSISRPIEPDDAED